MEPSGCDVGSRGEHRVERTGTDAEVITSPTLASIRDRRQDHRGQLSGLARLTAGTARGYHAVVVPRGETEFAQIAALVAVGTQRSRDVG